MFSYVSRVLELDTTHRFFQKGHRQNEGDSMHAVIENAKKRQSVIYTPDQWTMLIRMAKVTGHPYIVKEMSQNDFYSFADIVKSQNWIKDEEGDKMKISKVKEVSFCKTPAHQKMNFKYDFSSRPRTINLKKSRRTISEDLPKLHQQLLPIESLYRAY
ncbi:hypothetical protein ILUMI_17165 [Ignelater luminosus]|uniref:Uncharacterized protein n=1 Tax=Ignelater luminosus TaxID=2038154 RepID=A0A8K0CQY8_IGNLU|nr:hypothetical protein ILUMI_17165 [Ignelater luminosus]